jgi:hypothetical protein
LRCRLSHSLENMLVTIPNPRAVSRTNYMSDIWIVGDAYATHSNARGGLTLGVYDGQWDANPEALVGLLHTQLFALHITRTLRRLTSWPLEADVEGSRRQPQRAGRRGHDLCQYHWNRHLPGGASLTARSCMEPQVCC